MLKRYAAETDCKTKDRMMLVIKVVHEGAAIYQEREIHTIVKKL